MHSLFGTHHLQLEWFIRMPVIQGVAVMRLSMVHA